MNKLRQLEQRLCDGEWSPHGQLTCVIAAGVVGGAVIGAVGSSMAAGKQASAAEQAAADQQESANADLSLNASIFNAQAGLAQTSREAGGLAQSREAYLLGLSPDLDISSDFSSPYITTNQNGSSLYWSGPAGTNPVVNPGGGTVSSSGVPTGGASFGGGVYGGTSGAGATPNPNAGVSGLPGYGSFASPYNPSTFYEDPGYNFMLQQGESQITNQAATTGLALSPSALSAALSYNSGLASQEFNNAYNRSINTQTTDLNELNAVASGGQIATSGLSSAATNLGSASGSALSAYGNAGAAGAIGVGNAVASGINGTTSSVLSGINQYNNYTNGGLYNNPNNLNSSGGGMATYYTASGQPYQGTVASGGFAPTGD